MENKTKKNLVIVALASSLSASAAIMPVLSSIAKAFPDWANWVQFLITIPTLMIMVASLLVNPLLKRFSDKSITVTGLILIIFSGVYPYFSKSFPLLILSRVIMGFGLGLVTTISSSLAAGYFPVGKDRDRATGLQAAFSSFGGVVFSYLSGWVASIYWEGIFLVQLLNLVPLVFVLLFMKSNESFKEEDSTNKESTPNGQFFVKEAVLLTVLAFICVTITVTLPLNLSLFIDSKAIGDTRLAGTIASINSFIGFLIGLAFPEINKIFKDKTLPLSLFLVGVSFLIMSKSTASAVFLMASTIFGIATSIIYPSFLTTIYREVPENKIVASIGMYTVATNISQFVSPFIINNIARIFSPTIEARFILAAVLIFLLAGFILVYYSKKNKSLTN